ncbi:UDP-phosphate galactose phosphotransferase, partial [Pluralibacter gergoviae]
WYFSRYVWLFTWTFAALLFPMMRMFVKYLLNIFKLWLRDTWIIGDGANAREAFNAINSEVNLGLRIVGFISNKKNSEITLSGQNLPVIKKDFTWLKSIDKNTQFIVAVESEEGAVRNSWLKEFMIRGYRYVSVIPTLRGMPLDSTDMAFIFSHEVMIFRVQQNLAKWSSRLAKRLFDIIGSLIIIILLSP